jgi:hypothetical protein
MKRRTTCRNCGAPIVLIKTGKNHTEPCNATPVIYWDQKKGKGPELTVVTEEGEVLEARIRGKLATAAGIGFLPHKGRCKNGGDIA